MEKEQIKKALHCCAHYCGSCNKYCPLYTDDECTITLAKSTLALINSYENKIFELENRLKECENGYEGTLYLERCKLHDAEEKNKELTEENEGLKDYCTKLKRCYLSYETLYKVTRVRVDYTKADTVRKMQERLKASAFVFASTNDGRKYFAVEIDTIDQIAKETLEENDGT